MTPLRRCVLAAAVLLAACSGVEGADTSAPPETTATSSTDPVVETTTTTLVESGTGTEELAPEIRRELDALIVLTQELRGLPFLTEPAFEVVTREELADLVLEQVEEDLENADVDEELYRLLGLLDADTDLVELYSNLLAEQVAGFYDLETEELVVPMRSDGFSPLERSTIVHELTHAVTDQHFEIGDLFEQLVDEQRFDEVAALQAVIEGDAVNTEVLFIQGLSFEDQRSILEESLAADTTVLDGAPDFLVDSLLFPYVEGPAFVGRLLDLDGFDGVNAAYQDPPRSTEQILSPEDQDVPKELPELVVLIPEGYEVEYDSVWGQLGFDLMFDQILGERTEAVSGWGGDRYVTLFDGDDAVLVLAYEGDDPDDDDQLASALREYVPAAMAVGEGTDDSDGTVFEGDDYAWVGVIEGRLTFVAASDPAVGAQVVEGMKTP